MTRKERAQALIDSGRCVAWDGDFLREQFKDDVPQVVDCLIKNQEEVSSIVLDIMATEDKQQILDLLSDLVSVFMELVPSLGDTYEAKMFRVAAVNQLINPVVTRYTENLERSVILGTSQPSE